MGAGCPPQGWHACHVQQRAAAAMLAPRIKPLAARCTRASEVHPLKRMPTHLAWRYTKSKESGIWRDACSTGIRSHTACGGKRLDV